MRFIQKYQKTMHQKIREAYLTLGIDEITAQILYARNIMPEQASDFLMPSLENLHNPFLFCQMEKICNRLHEAEKKHQYTVIYGDYDCDGVCGSVILKKTLDQLKIPCRIYLPDRATEGYGTNRTAMEKLVREGIELLITVDCGIRSNDDVDFLKKKGIDTIILDHHECDVKLPDTPYILNGKVKKEKYPFTELCGAGIAFKLAQALLGQGAYAMLEFAGVATIADMVPLIGENRILAYYGLQNLNMAPSIGLKNLMAVAGIHRNAVDEHSVGFGIAPRINAAGRLAHGMLAVQLLLGEQQTKAVDLACQLNELNEQRQKLQKQVIFEAEQMVREQKDLSKIRVIIVSGKGWDKGVVGLAAASIAAKFCRPAVILTEEDGMLTGSARSIPGINLYELLSTCQQEYTRFGGHEMAAGLTFPARRLQWIEHQINEKARNLYSDEAFLPTAYYDIPITLEEINLNLAEQMEILRPFGQNNEQPLFLIRNYIPNYVMHLGDGSHLKMKEPQTDILWFHATEQIRVGSEYDFTASLCVNTFRLKRSSQLIVHSLQEKRKSGEEWKNQLKQEYLRNFPLEIEAFWHYWQGEKKEAIHDYDINEILIDMQNHPFGSVIFVNSIPGLEVVNRWKQKGLVMREVMRLDENSAENCICYTKPPKWVQNYQNILLVGCFDARISLKKGQKCLNYADEGIKRLYKEEAKGYFVDEEKLYDYAKALYLVGREGFQTLGELLKRTSEILQEDELKKIWFAWKVSLRQKLLQIRKNDKIYVIFNELETNFEENTLLKAIHFLLSE